MPNTYEQKIIAQRVQNILIAEYSVGHNWSNWELAKDPMGNLVVVRHSNKYHNVWQMRPYSSHGHLLRSWQRHSNDLSVFCGYYLKGIM